SIENPNKSAPSCQMNLVGIYRVLKKQVCLYRCFKISQRNFNNDTNLFKGLQMLYDQNALETSIVYTDEQLLQQIAEDDRTAFTILYRRYWEGLFITASKVLRGKEEAADVVQDVFLSFWKRRHELILQGSLAAYLHTSIRYKCIHYIEKNITRRDYLLLITEVEVNSISINAESHLDLMEIQQMISMTVAKMPPKMQEVYKLSREEYLSHKEIAAYLHISVDTVRKHIQHALYLIRKNLRPITYIFVMVVFFYLY
ncbi:MAG: RNA polymerase sigma-70 factor, partial [Chitinophagaceae bacterium]